MPSVTVVRRLEAPLAEVFATVADPRRFAQHSILGVYPPRHARPASGLAGAKRSAIKKAAAGRRLSGGAR